MFNHVNTKARKTLEYRIFYDIQKQLDPRHILFIGSADYTSWYHHLFRNCLFETIDADPDNAISGSPHGHHVADITSTKPIWPHNTFDVVIFNGVYGFGLQTSDQLKHALSKIHDILKPGGILIFGWTNIPKNHDPLNLSSCIDHYFKSFTSYKLNGKTKRKSKEWKQHCYTFFQKS